MRRRPDVSARPTLARPFGAVTIDVSQTPRLRLMADERAALLGHAVNRARRRYLAGAEWIVARDACGVLGLTAHHRVASEVRLALEFLLDRSVLVSHADRVVDVLLAATEVRAHDDGIRCLMFMVESDVPLDPFQRRGYSTIGIDSAGAWVQKTICAVPQSSDHVWRSH